MRKHLMNLRNVPEDEAEEVRSLLERNGIEFYETPPGAWGISGGGIWLKEPEQDVRARQLLKTYQAERQQRMRSEYEARKKAGEVDGFIAFARKNPLRLIFYVVLSATVLMIFAAPVYQLATG